MSVWGSQGSSGFMHVQLVWYKREHLAMTCLVRSNKTTARFRAASRMFESSVRPMQPTGSGSFTCEYLHTAGIVSSSVGSFWSICHRL